MPRPSRAALELSERYELALDSAPTPGRVGARLTRSGGAGTEFHDSRSYQVGDDVRRIDWRAFARSDQLMVRVWREEVLARVEVLLDTSRSMAVDPAKAALALDLAQVIGACARRDGCSARVVPIAAGARALELDEFAARGVEFDQRAPFDLALREALEHVRRGSIVVVLSDFLFPHDPRTLLAPLTSRSGALACVQLLSADELAPPSGEALRLVDAENGEALDLVLDDAVIAGYRQRLQRLCSALEEECRRAKSPFVSLDASVGLETHARGALLRAGLLAPR
jgi:uncharacterized protein (DUF58 family)